jgi:glutamate dehydrogenase
MHGKIPAARLELIERIAARARKQRTPVNAKQFIHAYYHGVSEEDLAERRPEDLAAAALAHLELGKTRKPGKPLVRVFNPDPASDGFSSTHTLIALVTDDMPFLVDSIGIIFNQSSLAIHFIAHPVLTVQRDASGQLKDLPEEPGKNDGDLIESWQLFEVDRVPDEKGLNALSARILVTLEDVRSATSDWLEMRRRARTIAGELESQTPGLPSTEVIEAKELLEWMEDNHFTFLGYREYRLKRGRTSDQLEPDRDSGLGLLRPGREHARTPRVVELTGEIRDNAREKTLLIITKANTVSTVHRATYLDYVGIKTFDSSGEVRGERRFIGLWTSSAYSKSPREIPVLRHKIQGVISHFGVSPTSHDGKAVLHVLETYPRDELFQASVADLVRIVRGIVNLYERQQVRLFVRRDAFRRFYSCLVYVPRDRYNGLKSSRAKSSTAPRSNRRCNSPTRCSHGCICWYARIPATRIAPTPPASSNALPKRCAPGSIISRTPCSSTTTKRPHCGSSNAMPAGSRQRTRTTRRPRSPCATSMRSRRSRVARAPCR